MKSDLGQDDVAQVQVIRRKGVCCDLRNPGTSSARAKDKGNQCGTIDGIELPGTSVWTRPDVNLRHRSHTDAADLGQGRRGLNQNTDDLSAEAGNEIRMGNRGQTQGRGRPRRDVQANIKR